VRRRAPAVLVTWIALAPLFTSPLSALPPLDTVTNGLEDFRSRTGDVVGNGTLTYGSFHDVAVHLVRGWESPLRLELADATLIGDWNDGQLDVVLRLLGAALSAESLDDALRELGRSLEPAIETLAFVDDTPVYVLGGALDAPTAHLWVERDTYRLRAIDLPMPEGVYVIELNEYTLAEGWFPSEIVVRRGETSLLRLTLSDLRRGSE
jgi:hypothetical protein